MNMTTESSYKIFHGIKTVTTVKSIHDRKLMMHLRKNTMNATNQSGHDQEDSVEIRPGPIVLYWRAKILDLG